MKKSIIICVLSCLFLASCGQKPEEQVRDFTESFIGFVNSNQKDSVKKYYPGFDFRDSLVQITSNTITVNSGNMEGIYTVELGPETFIDVKLEKGRGITVEESKGLIAFPKDKLDLAKKTGMWDESLADSELSQRMKDEGFFKFISNKLNFNPDRILTVNSKLKVTKVVEEWHYDDIYGYYTITNNTEQTIYPSDYKMNFADNHEGGGEEGIKRYSEPGKEISPGQTIKIEVNNYSGQGGEHEDHHLVGVTILLTPEEIMERFAKFSGNEYQEYLDSKK